MQIERLHLKTARRQRGMTAFELAQMIGTTENRVYGIERGRYSPDTDLALRWAAALGLNPDEAFQEIWGAK